MKKIAISLDEVTIKRLDDLMTAKKTINRTETIRYLLNVYEDARINRLDTINCLLNLYEEARSKPENPK